MPYRKKGGQMWYCRVVTRDKRRAVFPTGTRLERAAGRVEHWLRDLKDNHDRFGILDAILDKKITLARAYALGEIGTRDQLAREAEERADIDLRPLLKEFVRTKEKSNKGAASATKYETQINILYPPTAPFRRSDFTVARLSAALDRLDVSDATRNRYRAAASNFAKFLVRREILPFNIARQSEGFAEGDGRIVWYDRETAERVLQAISDPLLRAREAFFAGTGADWSDADRLRVRDINLKTYEVRCHGAKTPWRNRVIRITERWTIPHIRVALADKLPDAKVFAGSNSQAITYHHRAVAVAKAEPSTLHDWRHTYAVNALRRGEKISVVAHQLGHHDGHLVWKRYGRFVPNATDYVTSTEHEVATELATETISPIQNHA